MSGAITEPIPSEQAVAPSPSRPRALVRWFRRVVVLVVLLWLASEGISLVAQHTGLRRILTAHLQSAFGRPVEVGSYNFSFVDGLALEANAVSVAEDPRFGREYFLRADSMSARLRWASLLRGRLEFGTLSLNRPSLNLVRNSAGDWNLLEWLPQPGGHPGNAVPIGPAFPSSALRFRRIEVDGGRIDFKNGDEKLPFAFVGVKGSVETDRPGRWRVNLEATPWRAAVVMQQAGAIRVTGDLGGTSSRLRPAALDINWSDASISDVLRLATGDDAGIRGTFGLQASVRTREQDAMWEINGRAQLQQVHRWNLAARTDAPSLSLAARTNWNPAGSEIEFADIALDTPHSNLHASGRLLWNRMAAQPKQKSSPVQFAIDSYIDPSDLLPWLRAFHAGIADNLALTGAASLRGDITGWPPRIASASLSSSGAQLSGTALRHAARLHEFRLGYDHGIVSLAPLAIAFGPSDDAVHFEIAKPGRAAGNSLHLSANVSDVHDVLAAAGALGWNLSHGWDVSGPVRADLRWPDAEHPWKTPPIGFIDWGAGVGAVTLRVPFLNRPVGGINAVSQWKPGSRHVALASAEAFGARWTGSLDRSDPSPEWRFSLAGDRLAAADLDRWLNPAWRESFLDRMLPFLNARSPAAPENLRAGGRLALDQLTLAPLVVRKLQGDLRIDGRHIVFENAAGQFYGGEVTGSLDARLLVPPAYRADLSFSHIDAATLATALPALAGITAQSLQAQISVELSGANRSDLMASLSCQGSAAANAPELRNLSGWKERGAGSPGSAPVKFASANASFSCAQRKIEFQRLAIETGAGNTAVGTGSIDFSRNLDLSFRMRSAGETDSSFRLTGPLAAPKAVSSPAPSRRSR
jgi:AsmA-like C-terminal region